MTPPTKKDIIDRACKMLGRRPRHDDFDDPLYCATLSENRFNASWWCARAIARAMTTAVYPRRTREDSFNRLVKEWQEKLLKGDKE